MVYFTNTADAQTVYLPKSLGEGVGALTLTLRSTVDLDNAFDGAVIDLKTSDLYYRVPLSLPKGTPAGEYEYSLVDSTGDILASGVARVGDYAGFDEYNKDITYEQYNAE